MKLLVISLFLLLTGIRLALQFVHYRSANNPIPDNVADVYDSATYLKWQNYHGEQSRLNLFETLLSSAITLLLLVLNVFSSVANLFGENVFASVFAVVLFQIAVDFILSLPFHYINTMKIEEKYGFNRSNKGTFVKDEIIELLVGTVISAFVVLAIYVSHLWLGNSMAVLLGVLLCLFVLLVNLLFPVLGRLQNKFTPLEEGSLREKLTRLLTDHGYSVKDILVMDASRRTTKSNAYFSGLGKSKRIVLYDTLVNTMTEDEICAVFAHELGHGLHRDIPKLLAMNCGNMVLTAFLAWGIVSLPSLYAAFGFSGVNYGFAYLVLLSVAMPALMQLTSFIINAVSRKAEYRADAQAHTEGYGDALILALKRLAKENFAHLSPSPLLVAMEANHPPLSARIAAIEKLKQQGQ